jgi:hypothetical protein
MDTTTLLIIVLLILLFAGGGWYGPWTLVLNLADFTFTGRCNAAASFLPGRHATDSAPISIGMRSPRATFRDAARRTASLRDARAVG